MPLSVAFRVHLPEQKKMQLPIDNFFVISYIVG